MSIKSSSKKIEESPVNGYTIVEFRLPPDVAMQQVSPRMEFFAPNEEVASFIISGVMWAKNWDLIRLKDGRLFDRYGRVKQLHLETQDYFHGPDHSATRLINLEMMVEMARSEIKEVLDESVKTTQQLVKRISDLENWIIAFGKANK